MCVRCETVESQVEKYNKNKPVKKGRSTFNSQMVKRLKAAYGISEYIYKRWESLPLYKRLLIRFNICKQK